MIKHVVIMKLRELEDKEKYLRELQQRLEELPGKINVIQHLEVGINMNQSAKASDLILYSEFKSYQDLDTYRFHSEHQKVVQYLKDIVTETRVVDYEV